MKVLISAAEASSDHHGAQLLKAIRVKLAPSEKLEVFGIGGPELKAEGLEIVVDARELLVMGFLEVLVHLPQIFSSLKQVTQAAKERRPDVAVVIDYPDFHFRLAKRLKKLGIPLVYYIPPKVWAWRQGRVHFLKKFFDKILCIFPFEEDFYRQFQIPVSYVGNPLMDQLPFHLTKEQARIQMRISSFEKVALLMVGSRPSEIKHHLPLFLDAAQRTAEAMGSNLKVLMPFPRTTSLPLIQEKVEAWKNLSGSKGLLDIVFSSGNSAECMVAADGALIKSGTSTLEAGLLACPHVVVFKPSKTGAWIFKHIVRYRGAVGLVNLVAGHKAGDPTLLVPEILCDDATPERLTSELTRLLNEGPDAQMLKGFERIKALVQGPSPSARAAEEILALIHNREVFPEKEL